jgi:hypothetical protein
MFKENFNSNSNFFKILLAEVTIKQLKERVRQAEEGLQNTIQVSQFDDNY